MLEQEQYLEQTSVLNRHEKNKQVSHLSFSLISFFLHSFFLSLFCAFLFSTKMITLDDDRDTDGDDNEDDIKSNQLFGMYYFSGHCSKHFN